MSLKGKRILYISYNGMLEPLGQSQVIPYLVELSKQGAVFTLLSFERANAFTSAGAERAKALKRILAKDDIEWHWLRYHKSPSLPATAFDVIHGIRKAEQLIRRNLIELVHARSHIPAMIALRMKQQFGVKMIFDLRGLMADEYVDAEHWRKDSVAYRITKSLERKALSAADGVVTLTEKIWPLISTSDGLQNVNVAHQVVPCCVDLDRFVFNEETRRATRMELALSENRRVLVYSGSIGGWYLTEEMGRLFAQFVKQSANWHFLWLTTGPATLIRKVMSDLRLNRSHYTVKQASYQEVPAYLSAADAGTAFYKPAMSRLATSPIKVAEYLACGLPLIINAGIGDSDALITEEQLGVLIENFSDDEYVRAAAVIERLAGQAEATRTRSRNVAERLFDIRTVGVQRYARLYGQVLATTN